jgi:hypothetical protein
MEYFQSLYDLVYDYINPPDVLFVPTTAPTAVKQEDVDNLIDQIKKEIILEDKHFKMKYEDLEQRLNSLQKEDDSKGQDDDNNNNFEKISVKKKKKILKTAFFACIVP